MSFDLNKSMVDLAKSKSLELAKELQANAVIIIIAHSRSQIAVGHANDTSESSESVAKILNEAAADFLRNPP